MEQRIMHKPLTNAVLKTIPNESAQFIFFNDECTDPWIADVQLFTIENGICTVYSGSGHATGLQIASAVRKFPMLTGHVNGDAWDILELDWRMNLYIRKDRTPEFNEVMNRFMELPHGVVFLNNVNAITGIPDIISKVLAEFKSVQQCMARHWKTCTLEVMKKLA